jgi:hypothetical protein
MKKTVILGALAIITALFINSCENKEALPMGIAPLSTSCDTTHLTYSGGINTIINTQCAVSGCHNGTSSTANDFTSYYALQPYATAKKGPTSSEFYTCLYEGTPYQMPNVAQPGWTDACTQAKLKQWILDGAPQ